MKLLFSQMIHLCHKAPFIQTVRLHQMGTFHQMLKFRQMLTIPQMFTFHRMFNIRSNVDI